MFEVLLSCAAAEERFVVLQEGEVVRMVLKVGLEFGGSEDFGFEFFDSAFSDEGFGDGFEGVGYAVVETVYGGGVVLPFGEGVVGCALKFLQQRLIELGRGTD